MLVDGPGRKPVPPINLLGLFFFFFGVTDIDLKMRQGCFFVFLFLAESVCARMLHFTPRPMRL